MSHGAQPEQALSIWLADQRHQGHQDAGDWHPFYSTALNPEPCFSSPPPPPPLSTLQNDFVRRQCLGLRLPLRDCAIFYAAKAISHILEIRHTAEAALRMQQRPFGAAAPSADGQAQGTAILGQLITALYGKESPVRGLDSCQVTKLERTVNAGTEQSSSGHNAERASVHCRQSASGRCPKGHIRESVC